MRLVLLLGLFLSIAFSHKLNLFMYEENGKVYVSSYFASGANCRNCKVEVYDENNTLIDSGKTDKKGEYIIHKLSKQIKVKVEALGGHAAIDKLQLKNIKSKQNIKIEKKNSFLESFIAIALIVLIFVFLRKVVK